MNEQDIATAAIMELVSLGRYPGKPLDQFICKDEYDFESYIVPAEEMDGMVRAMCRWLDSASRSELLYAPSYQSDINGYNVGCNGRPFTGNSTLNDTVPCQIDHIEYDPSTGRVDMRTSFWCYDSEGQFIQVQLTIQAVAEPDTGNFYYERISATHTKS